MSKDVLKRGRFASSMRPGKTYPDLLASGSMTDLVLSGLTGGTGFFTESASKSHGVLCNAPTTATAGVLEI